MRVTETVIGSMGTVKTRGNKFPTVKLEFSVGE